MFLRPWDAKAIDALRIPAKLGVFETASDRRRIEPGGVPAEHPTGWPFPPIPCLALRVQCYISTSLQEHCAVDGLLPPICVPFALPNNRAINISYDTKNAQTERTMRKGKLIMHSL